MFFLGIILLLFMVGYSVIKANRIPQSISETAYIVPKWVFTVGIMLIGITFMPYIIMLLSVKYEWLAFLFILGLWCVAASPYYKTEQVKLHYIGAVVCFLNIMAITFLIKPLCLLIWVIYPLCMFKKIRNWWLMIAECLCFLQLIIAISL